MFTNMPIKLLSIFTNLTKKIGAFASPATAFTVLGGTISKYTWTTSLAPSTTFEIDLN